MPDVPSLDSDPLQTVDLPADAEVNADQCTGNSPASTPDGTQREPPASASFALPGYEILGVLGRGGMGVVYKARQLAANRIVGLKMILRGEHASAGDLRRFQRRAEAVARLSHPNIVAVHEVGTYQGLPYFTLEYVAGGNLAQQLKGNPQPARRSAELVEQLAPHHATCASERHRASRPETRKYSVDCRREPERIRFHTKQSSRIGVWPGTFDQEKLERQPR